MYGRDIVAPPGNQADNREHKHQPVASEVPSLLDKYSAYLQVPMVAALLPSCIAWISADLKRNTSPQRRYRTHNGHARGRLAALRQSGPVESPKQSIDDEWGSGSSPFPPTVPVIYVLRSSSLAILLRDPRRLSSARAAEDHPVLSSGTGSPDESPGKETASADR